MTENLFSEDGIKRSICLYLPYSQNSGRCASEILALSRQLLGDF